MDKDILNALTDALLSVTGDTTTTDQSKWYVCVYDAKGTVKKTEVASVFQAEMAVNDYLHAGWAAWLQDHEGNCVVVATRPKELN